MRAWACIAPLKTVKFVIRPAIGKLNDYNGVIPGIRPGYLPVLRGYYRVFPGLNE